MIVILISVVYICALILNLEHMKTLDGLLCNILFLIEKSQKKGSQRLNADKSLLYWEIGRLRCL